MFAKFLGIGKSGSEKVGATRSHPATFDPNLEHELLVVMKGGRFQAWMDGKWWGEGHADPLLGGGSRVMFLPDTVITKEEVAELAPPDSPSL